MYCEKGWRLYQHVLGAFACAGESGSGRGPEGFTEDTNMHIERSSRNMLMAAALLTTVALLTTLALPIAGQEAEPVRTASGLVEGTTTASGIRLFRGIPYAAPPVDELRWREPQPVTPWTGVRGTRQFGPRCMQHAAFGDMGFRSSGVGEDCLYLNVWTPARSADERLPVLVYFYGGGFVAGDGSEPRYDGESMARRGIVTLTVNYRLGAFGFLAHPELTAESPHRASGNFGLLDQAAALRWVRENIAAFGGDPGRVTIGGESAGSASVSAQMASPLSRGLIAGAIGQSGAQIPPTMAPVPLATGEQNGLRFMNSVGAESLADLRALSSQEILDASLRHGIWSFSAVVDGHFLPRATVEIYAAGEQARVPLLVGWNSEEMNHRALLGPDPATPEGYANAVRRHYGEHADAVLRLYPGRTEEEVLQSATDLAGDRFIAFSTWRWADLHTRTGGGRPVYRYFYTRPRPPMRPEMGNAVAGLAGGVVSGPAAEANRPPPPRGAVHAAEIEYALGNLDRNHVFAWTPEDHRVSETMQGYFANFIKTGDPNGPGLPRWPALSRGRDARFMRLDVESGAQPDRTRARYELLERIYTSGARP
jgi:para-nitrobenzyl esterase